METFNKFLAENLQRHRNGTKVPPVLVGCLLVNLFLVGVAAVPVSAQERSSRKSRAGLKQPIFRVAESARNAPPAEAHPLDNVLQMAQGKLAFSRQHVRGYSANLVKREQVDGVLLDHQFVFLKVRNERLDAAGLVAVPFGVYMYFEGPDDLKDREVLWVKGQNNNKLIAHEGSGLLGLLSVWLEPTSAVAMRGQRYPISYVGMENLLQQYILRLQEDKRQGVPEDFKIKVIRGARVDDRVCTCTQVTHPVQRPYFEKYVSRLFIDDETHLPIRYVTFGWPERKGVQPPIIEEYTYRNVKVNPGFTEVDFDPKNSNYNF